MSFVPTAGNHLIVDAPNDQTPGVIQPGGQLVSWVVGKFTPWELHRDRGYKDRWGQYWRMWRGMWDPTDRNRGSERSRIVAPALAQAIEMTTSEIEEGLFSKDVWFDIDDNLADQEKDDALVARDILREDLESVNAKDAVSEAVLNGAIFGTGIIKINTEVNTETVLVPGISGASVETDERVRVTWESIRPDEFVPDPAGRNIHEMLGVFHKVKKPVHAILEKIESGIYLASAAPLIRASYKSMDTEVDSTDPQNHRAADEGEELEIIEYHGKVPASFLYQATTDRVTRDEDGQAVLESVSDLPVDEILAEGDETEMVEAIVTIANQNVLLRARANPFLMKDRSIIAFQFEKVPGRFWGRGVAEKGFNPQKALDAEMRARIDALAFVSSPMMAVDGGRLPRGFKAEVRPGKIWITQGPPNDVLAPVNIGQIQPNTFNQTQELERMVQMGTGAFDTASGLKSQGGQSNGPSATNVSLMMGAFVKRAKRAIRNVNDNLVQPLIKQTMWRYIQFDPQRYPQDVEFRVMATMGIVAREVEGMQLTQLMGMLPDEFPQVSVAVAKGVIDLSSIHNKVEVVNAMEQAMAPPSEEEQARTAALEEAQFTAVRAEAQGKLLANQKTMAEVRKLLAEVEELIKGGDQDDEKLEIEKARLLAEFEQLEILHEQNAIALKRLDLMEKQLQAKLRQN